MPANTGLSTAVASAYAGFRRLARIAPHLPSLALGNGRLRRGLQHMELDHRRGWHGLRPPTDIDGHYVPNPPSKDQTTGQ